jgi:uncharacterized spore protein YtfJ
MSRLFIPDPSDPASRERASARGSILITIGCMIAGFGGGLMRGAYEQAEEAATGAYDQGADDMRGARLDHPAARPAPAQE